MREVKYGWLIRYLHTTGASPCLLWSTCTCSRALLYRIVQAPRELLYGVRGSDHLLALMAEGFMGYVLPWGNMSYLAATVGPSN